MKARAFDIILQMPGVPALEEADKTPSVLDDGVTDRVPICTHQYHMGRTPPIREPILTHSMMEEINENPE